MKDIPENDEQNREPSRSRRTFFNWVGQIVAGASLVSIGLSLGNPANALATSLPSKSAPNAPDCIPCPGRCVFTSCNNDGCDPPSYNYRIKYTVYSNACVPPGQQCPYTNYSYCGSSCCARVPSNCGCP